MLRRQTDSSRSSIVELVLCCRFVGGSSEDFEGDFFRTEVDGGCQLLKKCTVRNRAGDC